MPRLAMILTLLLLAAGLSSCATLPVPPPCAPVQVPPPKLPPPPADLMLPPPAVTFRQRLLDFFSNLPTTPTGSPASLPPAKQ